MLRVAIALLAGLLVGALFAVVTRGEETTPVRTQAVPTATPAPETGPPIRDTRVRFTVPDPNGGPPWAVRTFTVEAKRERAQCSQLGRIQNGVFGWVDPRSGFRPVRAFAGGPSACAAELRFGLSRFALPDDKGGAAATITWGRLPRRVESVELEDGTRLTPRAQTVLDVHPGLRKEIYADGTFVLTGGERRPLLRPRMGGGHEDLLFASHGDAEVAVRVSDPAGGVPWGVLVAEDGCLSSSARVLGTWLGRIDPSTGGLYADPFGFASESCREGTRPTPARPVALNISISGGDEEDEEGSQQLRRLPGRTALSGQVLGGVESVTLVTPRDTRTLQPSAEGRAILAVYDGSFPGKDITTIAHFSDGRSVEQTFEAG